MTKNYWLMKAEPDSRIVKGKDVKFSVDDFESMKTSPWEGVRNHEAKKLMQQMKVGDEIAFYHSNCKNPGIAGFAEVSKEAYPDYTSWDPDHPYFDPKTDKESPKWFMVDVTFKARAKHFVSLSLMKRIASFSTSEPSKDVAYIGEEGVEAVKNMALIKRGRLSVQPVEEDAWRTIHLLANNGGWPEDEKKKGPSKLGSSSKQKAEPGSSKRTSKKRTKTNESEHEGDDDAFHEIGVRPDVAEEESRLATKHGQDVRDRDIETEGTSGPQNVVAKPSSNSKELSKAKRRKLDISGDEAVTPRRSARVRK